MFSSPGTSLGELDLGSAATLIGASSDITLVLDPDGTVRDIAVRSRALAADLDDSPNWIGQKLSGLVAIDSKPKVATLIRDASTEPDSRWRHLNHMTASGSSVPVLYCAVPIPERDRIILFGRDLRPMSDLQQRLMDVQQSLERDYSRMREVEARYRLLFQMSSEAVLVIDAERLRVIEVNPAASDLLHGAGEELTGRHFTSLLDPDSAAPVQGYLRAVRAGRRAADVQALLHPRAKEARKSRVLLRASLFRQGDTTLFLVRLVPPPAAGGGALPDTRHKVLDAVERGPDGFVLTDEGSAILVANASFLGMAQLPHESAALGESLERWLGQTEIDLQVLISNLRQRGTVRAFATVLRGQEGAITDVEVSGVTVRNGGPPCFGFAIRNTRPRAQNMPDAARRLPRSVEQLTELIGRVPLKDLVREATEVIEKLSIQAALELTRDNRASAADMLGLSRQSLYVKLRRYGIGEIGDRE